MKKAISVILAFSIMISLCYLCSNKGIYAQEAGNSPSDNKDNIFETTNKQSASSSQAAINYSNKKAIWLSQYDLFNVFTDGKSQRSEEDFRLLAQKIIDNIAKDGFNTIFLQVRPYGDSICASELYPPSYILTGDYSKKPKYDAVKFIVDAAHEKELSIHAWINPLRAIREDQMSKIDDKYTVKKWYNDIMKNGDYIVNVEGKYYFNPTYKEVRDFIVSGVDEILTDYAFDGVHMDDSFYPTWDKSFDSKSYKKYLDAGGTLGLGTFRRHSINLLVKSLYDKTHEKRQGAVFGISPSSLYDNAFIFQYADIYTWCSEDGFVDYICPQIYFGFEHENNPFDILCLKWAEFVTNPDVDLIIGVSLEKTYNGEDQYAGSGKNEWVENKDVLKRCIEFALELKGCKGMSFLSYWLFYDPESGEEVEETKAERDNFIPVLKKAVFCISGKGTGIKDATLAAQIEWQKKYSKQVA